MQQIYNTIQYTSVIAEVKSLQSDKKGCNIKNREKKNEKPGKIKGHILSPYRLRKQKKEQKIFEGKKGFLEMGFW